MTVVSIVSSNSNNRQAINHSMKTKNVQSGIKHPLFPSNTGNIEKPYIAAIMINLNYHASTALEKVLFPILFLQIRTMFDDKNTFLNKNIQTYKLKMYVYEYNKCKIVKPHYKF